MRFFAYLSLLVARVVHWWRAAVATAELGKFILQVKGRREFIFDSNDTTIAQVRTFVAPLFPPGPQFSSLT